MGSFFLRDLPAIVDARRSGETFDSQRAVKAAEKTSDGEEAADQVPTPKKSETDNVAGTLEALRAVLPAAFITVYTTGVILLQNAANATGASDRAEKETALAESFKDKPGELKKALEALPAETESLMWGRIGYVILACACLIFLSFWDANKKSDTDKTVIFEPAVVSAIFVVWALATPGTVLAIWHDPTNLAALTIGLAVFGAIVLFTLSATVLKKKTPTN